MLVAFFLYECFKEDVCHPVVPVSCYATTLRRRIIDVADKIVRHAGGLSIRPGTSRENSLCAPIPASLKKKTIFEKKVSQP